MSSADRLQLQIDALRASRARLLAVRDHCRLRPAWARLEEVWDRTEVPLCIVRRQYPADLVAHAEAQLTEALEHLERNYRQIESTYVVR